ncbi:hypothetical protein LCI18_006853 [Fusarium solani-melongenae]|uniref:Uncharacterized protein n=1 Tax=Fusarium solani subsp. cucurbitae TaxID=2747967 RepID=A0ACD3Z3S0_FUSSC|nr:hypothetical protein LCI18_006853 [Fusarium solani-melongenae]
MFPADITQSDIANTSYVNSVRAIKVPSGTTYRYVFSPPFDDEKPYLLFLHGYPESSYDWHHQMTYFTEQGYGIVAPDLLGYGGTDNPSDLQAFNFKNMVAELVQLLDCEGVNQVFAISHDFGSPLLSRFITYEPSRLRAVAFLGDGYLPPSTRVDAQAIDMINKATLAQFGYPQYGYFLTNNDDDAAAFMDQHLDSFVSIQYTRNTSIWTEHFSPVGAFRKWLEQDSIASDVFASRVNEEQWKTIMRAQGGFNGPLKWYKAMMRGINNPDTSGEDPLVRFKAFLTLRLVQQESGAIPHPCLLVLAERDPVAIPSFQLNSTVPYASNLRVRSVNAGHFIQTEAPIEVNRHLESFFRDVLETPDSDTAPINVCYDKC